MTLPWQIAQKLHAVTAAPPHPKIDDRAHDLVDVQLREVLTASADLGDTHCVGLALFEVRAQHQCPPTADALPHGSAIYARAPEGLDLFDPAQTVEAAA